MVKEPEPNTVQRISLNLTQRDLEATAALARAEGTNRTVAIQRAIQAKKFLRDVVDEGGKVLIQRKDGSLVEVVFQ
ncbi:hypothetical protein [Meiothermus granaticius]|uniref:Ribbon-helix-helix protein CopG domain-containing protein n=1 Tax=Meiothermus granaticius NBRC 107808 TaxID=1227551 RepID=A0A399F7E8_9DEIN|nr:hypothetical protein [Meiothermus granaticius]MCL6528307.1 hypothetical protein [Thermaceae bacterium]RIH91179.1 hypothetical protein Mgrana_02963 [Meiothermus granaticius NBRC 107808]GEM88380.1 hypothetical protein MGR01S_30050 [Meiothermus granaticius NBRC 107808]